MGDLLVILKLLVGAGLSRGRWAHLLLKRLRSVTTFFTCLTNSAVPGAALQSRWKKARTRKSTHTKAEGEYRNYLLTRNCTQFSRVLAHFRRQELN